MSNDLVKWLREVAVEMRVVGMARCDEAADRIETLEKALRFYAEYTPVFSQQDFRSVARVALEGKDER
jgi:hypothetical protein